MNGEALGWSWLGRVPYGDGLALQQKLAAERERGEGRDTLLLLEHDRIYTAGRRTAPEEILWNQHERTARGIELIKTDRGGKVTYHGPGQLVGYPIVDIRGREIGVRAWVELIERAIIDVLEPLGIPGQIECNEPGVWLGKAKIAAIGIHVSRGVSRHGFALNVAPNLGDYKGIVACGLHGRTVTSVADQLGDAPDVRTMGECVARSMAARLNLGEEEIPASELGAGAGVSVLGGVN
ncbi:MAG: lipoyl(octanoyl) transferase LipB [Chrysiogenetes bacterium]|nr:lipoyl(octanoyl) transferase LipB [Chrysiogenetes bacterium]